MPQYLKYIFPAANTQDLCLTQSTTGATNLVLNGNLANSNESSFVSFIANGYSRQLSFTSTNDLSGATFTIRGMQNGVTISETVTGPNNTTVYSTLIYDMVVSISVDMVILNIQVGTGYNGFFQLVSMDLTQADLNYSFSLSSLFSTNQISTTVYGTLDSISQNTNTYLTTIANNVGTLFTIKSIATNNLYIYPVSPITSVPIFNQILVQLTGSTSTLGNSITMIFIQMPGST